MKPFFQSKRVTLFHGDCLAVMKTLADCSVDAVVTDPPAGIGFMGVAWDTYGGKSGSPKTADEWDWSGSKERPRKSSDSRRVVVKQGRAFRAFLQAAMAECLRILKPGGHALVWAIPRTSHWTGTACEDAGFEVRDVCHHIFGSGLPKSMAIGKAIDRELGLKRELGAKRVSPDGTVAHDSAGKRHEGYERPWRDDPDAVERNTRVSYPASAESAEWDSWGSGLKPAAEHWILCRKPVSEKTLAANVLKWGVGGLNIDGCRVATGGDDYGRSAANAAGVRVKGGANTYGEFADTDATYANAKGRFPANLILSHHADCVCRGTKSVKNHGHNPRIRGKGGISTNGHKGHIAGAESREPIEIVKRWECHPDCPVRLLDEQSGQSKGRASGRNTEESSTNTYGWANGGIYKSGEHFGDTGGASRFFYSPKASRSDRNDGCEGLVSAPTLIGAAGHKTNPMTGRPVVDVPRANNHQTVKNTALMQFLCRLITPPGGLILDPFMGSGSTGKAAIIEGFRFIGIEQSKDYIKIAKARIVHQMNAAKPSTKRRRARA